MKKSIKYTYISKDILSEELEKYDFELLLYQLFVQEDNHCIRNEILSHYKIVILKKGCCRVVCNQKEYLLTEPGSIFFLSPFTIFDAYCIGDERVEFYHIHFTVAPKQDLTQPAELEAENSLLHLIKTPFFISSSKETDYLLTYVEHTMLEVENNIPGCYYMCKSFFMYLITILINLINAEYQLLYAQNSVLANKQELVLRCLTYLEDNMNRNVTVADLCTLTNVSQSYLYQCFMSTFQCSTKEYITKYKFRKLEKRLTQSDDSIEQIALAFGYPSVYAFSSSFKKHYGMSPTEYRKKEN